MAAQRVAIPSNRNVVQVQFLSAPLVVLEVHSG